MGNTYNLWSNSHNLITNSVYLIIYDILYWNLKKTFLSGNPSQARKQDVMISGDIAARMRHRGEEIKHGINVVLQMTPPLMPLQ